METKDRTFYPLIILFFILGLVIGYVIHQPGTEIKYITNTIEVPKAVETNVEVTQSPTPATTQQKPESTPVPDFEVKVYNPEKDVPTKTIEIKYWVAVPKELSMRPGQTVLIKVVDYSQPTPPNFIMGSYKREPLGNAGQIVIKFNKTGTYDYKVVIPSGDPTILPSLYAEGSIKVY